VLSPNPAGTTPGGVPQALPLGVYLDVILSGMLFEMTEPSTRAAYARWDEEVSAAMLRRIDVADASGACTLRRAFEENVITAIPKDQVPQHLGAVQERLDRACPLPW